MNLAKDWKIHEFAKTICPLVNKHLSENEKLAAKVQTIGWLAKSDWKGGLFVPDKLIH